MLVVMHATSYRRVHFPYSEYLILEELGDVKHEYFDGEIYAMAGGTPEHAALMSEISHIIRRQLSEERQTYSSELRLRVPTGLSTYPDCAVIWGEVQRSVEDRNAATNPLILVEVTSDATEKYDRGKKLEHYRAIPSLNEIVIVSHRERRVTLCRRDDDQRWTSSEAVAGESLQLLSIGAVLQVNEIYRNILKDI